MEPKICTLEAVLSPIQKVSVKQRKSMDAVTGGLVAGSVVSIILYVAGAVAVFSGIWQTMSSPFMLYLWLILLTGLTVGQLVLTGFVVSALMAAPHQEETKVV